MIGTTLRNSRILIAKRPILSRTTLSPISNAFYQIASNTTTTTAPKALITIQQRHHSLKPTHPTSTPTAPLYNLPPSVIEQIKLDLQSVDLDQNGKIDADELRILLKKHDTTFTDEEIVELSELFYASRGAGAVPLEEFVAALDSASGRNHKEFKTHPLGIGTCASEYM